MADLGYGLSALFRGGVEGAQRGMQRAEQRQRADEESRLRNLLTGTTLMQRQQEFQARQKQNKRANFNNVLRTAVLLSPESREGYLTKNLGADHGIKFFEKPGEIEKVKYRLPNGTVMEGTKEGVSRVHGRLTQQQSTGNDPFLDKAKTAEFYQNAINENVSIIAPKQEVKKPAALSPLGRLMSEMESLPVGDPRKKDYEDAIRKATMVRGGLSVTTPGGTRVTMGGPAGAQVPTMALRKPVQTHVQKEYVKGSEHISNLKQIISEFKPEFLTYKGKGIAGLSKIFEKAGGELPKEYQKNLKQYTEFANGVDQFFNVYRAEITGAAATLSELERLKKTMINTDQSPTEFRASANRLMKALARTQRLKQKLLREGIPLGSDEFNKRLDIEYTTKNNDVNIEERGNELESQGLSEDEIMQTLQNEYPDFKEL